MPATFARMKICAERNHGHCARGRRGQAAVSAENGFGSLECARLGTQKPVPVARGCGFGESIRLAIFK